MRTLRTRLTGVVFLAVLGGLVYLTVLLYNKAFTPAVEVTLRADRIGNQLSAPADVKLRGLIVGEVRGVSSTGNGATIDLALDPDTVELIPDNVRAQLLPKTLFGEKFVNLVLPDDPSGTPIGEGDVIPQDRSEAALETERVLNNLLPLLQTLEPEQLSLTLNAVSGALRGRGERLGGNLVAVDRYLRQLNPEMPALQENLQGLADYAGTLDAAAPDLLGLLDNFSAVSRNLVDQRQELRTFLAETSSATDLLEDVVAENERRLVQLAASSRPTLELLARYSPEFPCVAAGLRRYEPILTATFGGRQPGLHITLEATRDNGPYVRGDEPQYVDRRPPQCEGLPDPPVPQDDDEFRDGYRDRERAPVDQQPDGSGGGTRSDIAAAAAADPARYLAGDVAATPAGQRALLDAVTAPVLGVSVDAVPDLVQMLFGPLARGTQVGLS